jgi:surface antigen
MARSYLEYGTKLEEPKVGAVAVFERGKAPAGHVAFVTGWGDGKIRVLGGNQGDKVCEANYPSDSLIGLRWPPAMVPAGVSPAARLPRSGTLWGTIAGAGAGVMAYLDQTVAALLEWSAKLTELSPVQSALAGMGGNVKSMTLGLGIGAAVYVVSRRVKAAQEGKPG